jgi:hypothetical protein
MYEHAKITLPCFVTEKLIFCLGVHNPGAFFAPPSAMEAKLAEDKGNLAPVELELCKAGVWGSPCCRNPTTRFA